MKTRRLVIVGDSAFAEIAREYFDADTPLAGMRLTGITIWQGEYGPYVTFPAKPNTVQRPKFFEFLRAADASGSPEATGAIQRTKAWILKEWEAAGCPRSAASAARS